MIKPNLPQRRPEPPTISYYAMAVLSVAKRLELIASNPSANKPKYNFTTLICGPFFDWAAVQGQALYTRFRKDRFVKTFGYFHH
jgi:hypothetical protein